MDSFPEFAEEFVFRCPWFIVPPTLSRFFDLKGKGFWLGRLASWLFACGLGSVVMEGGLGV
jgi:hypothetical protein